ncbi:ABC transporter substrate-binding protein [Phytoactinopolyspora mesophila]|uniref:Extracellular solute-binding protein n=1 Tax=Phytoactinopolyspora mesophila TaxID=2650750 RepID=A0A7K3LZV8_9ACTN|nr:sugar ABC transporter substrate-binding protein [Phytoactinopolyspora mesophila]NDL56530.1 extracellular solute-binding protein [Phytoactinopolyspora mesophila]
MKNAPCPNRRAAVAVLAAGVLIALSACSGDDESSAEDATLEVWTRSNAEAAASYQLVFDAFTEETGIEIDYQPVQEFDTQLQARAGQGDLPDVLINDASSLGNYVAQGFVLPIDRESIEGHDEISDETWEQNLGTDGAYYGVPWSRQANITFIRKDWREELGYDVPTTWEELSALAEAFATEDPNGSGEDDTYGMVVPGSAQAGYIARWGNSYLWQAGAEILEDNGDGTFTSAINSPEAAEAMGWIRDQFCTPGIVVPGSVNLTTAETPFFGEGTAGIYLTGPYNISTFDLAVGQENVEIIPMPAGPASSTTFAEGETIYFGASSEKEDLQKQLAEFLISPDAQEIAMQVVETDSGMTTQPVVRLPVNQNVDIVEVTGDERWGIVQDSYIADSKPFPWSIDFLPFRQILADGMNAMASDCNSDIEAGLAAIDEQFQAQLESQDLS